MIFETDLLVIGAGPGGYVASLYAAKKGLKVTLIEKRFIGGTCLNIGCIATKAFAKSASLFHEMKHSVQFGIHSTDLIPDMALIQERKQAIVTQLVGGVEYLLKNQSVDVIRGSASFIDNETVSVKTEEGTQTYKAKHIIIATGSKVKRLPIEGNSLPVVFDSEKLLSLTKIPSSMMIVGGGIIGMEFAFIFGMLGTKVTVLEAMPQILPMVDKDITMRLMRFAKAANISLSTNAFVNKYAMTEEGLAQVHYRHNDEDKVVTGEFILEAIGRGPQTEGLGLENTTIALNKDRTIAVDDTLKTSVAHIYAIGDVTGKMQLAHVASHQGISAVDALLGNPHPLHYDQIPSVIFTHPVIATIGLSESCLKAQEIPYHLAKVPGTANGKALIDDEGMGVVKLFEDPVTKHLIGAQILGMDAENLIGILGLAIQNKLTAEDLKKTIFAHPTTSELIHEAGLGLLGEAIHYAD